MVKHFCDICGREFKNYSEIDKYKIKKEWHSWGESGWDKLEVHQACLEAMCKEIAKRRAYE